MKFDLKEENVDIWSPEVTLDKERHSGEVKRYGEGSHGEETDEVQVPVAGITWNILIQLPQQLHGVIQRSVTFISGAQIHLLCRKIMPLLDDHKTHK